MKKYRGGSKKVSEPKPLTAKNTCPKCGAKRIDNQLGLEQTPEIYIENTITWAREVWRVLRKDGTFWLNLGDSYAGSWGAMSHDMNGKAKRSGSNERPPQSFVSTKKSFRRDREEVPRSDLKTGYGLKPKDLVGIPWRVAFALQADGWWLRSAMPYVKRSAMPESCTDRPASALEYMFLLTKSSKYFFDMDAIRKEHRLSSIERVKHGWNGKSIIDEDGKERRAQPDPTDQMGDRWATPNGRNFRNTDLFYQSLEEPHGAIFCGEEMVGLDVNPQAYKECHFATFPEKIPEICIKAGTSEKGACPMCGAPWERMVETSYKQHPRNPNPIGRPFEEQKSAGVGYRPKENKLRNNKTIDWQPTCSHKAEPVPCVVLDPFGGSGTTKNVADRLGRCGVMCELKMEYIEIAKKRCYQLPELL